MDRTAVKGADRENCTDGRLSADDGRLPGKGGIDEGARKTSRYGFRSKHSEFGAQTHAATEPGAPLDQPKNPADEEITANIRKAMMDTKMFANLQNIQVTTTDGAASKLKERSQPRKKRN